MKIFHFGKEVRDGKGRWSSIKKKAKICVQNTVFVIGSIGIMYGVAIVQQPHEVHADVAQVITVKNTEAVKEMKQQLGDMICSRERGGHRQVPGVPFTTYDPPRALRESGACTTVGGKLPDECLSHGECQEKLPTIVFYSEKVYGKKITQMDAFAIANDPDKAREFLYECGVNVKGCITNWTTAMMPDGKTVRPEIQTKIDDIRTSMK